VQVLDDAAVDDGDALAAALRLLEGGDLALGERQRPGEGAKTSLATAIWSGWISVLPSKPMSRPWRQAARRPSASWKAL
jgi:hypothetical protein